MTTKLPAYLQKFAATSSDTDSLTQVKTSIPRISLKGKRFKFINGEDESKGASEIHVVILAVNPQGGLMAKTFYRGGYNPSDTSPPDCQSSNGVHPDAYVSEPVSERCSSCPNNMFGSATSTTGKKAKACKDSKVLWVAKPDDINGAVYGLRVPVTSLKSMAEFGKEVAKTGAPLHAIIAKLSMDEDNDFPMLQFEIAGFVSEEVFEVANERSINREFIQEDKPLAIEQESSGSVMKIEKREAVTIDHEDGELADAKTAEEIAQGW